MTEVITFLLIYILNNFRGMQMCTKLKPTHQDFYSSYF